MSGRSGPRSIVVVTAGLGQPSSTRLLADRLAAATERDLGDAGVDVEVRGRRAPRARPGPVEPPPDRLSEPGLQAEIDAVVAPTA